MRIPPPVYARVGNKAALLDADKRSRRAIWPGAEPGTQRDVAALRAPLDLQHVNAPHRGERQSFDRPGQKARVCQRVTATLRSHVPRWAYRGAGPAGQPTTQVDHRWLRCHGLLAGHEPSQQAATPRRGSPDAITEEEVDQLFTTQVDYIVAGIERDSGR